MLHLICKNCDIKNYQLNCVCKPHLWTWSSTSARDDFLAVLTMSMNLSTVKNWIKDVDSLGVWLRYDEADGKVTQIFCALCTKHVGRLFAWRQKLQ